MFTAALLDFDGTLCDTHRGIVICLQRTLADWDPDPSRVTDLLSQGLDLQCTVRELTGESEETVAKLVVAYRQLYSSGLALAESRLFPGVFEFLQGLAANKIPALVVSNKGGEIIEKMLEHFGLTPLIAGVVADRGEGGPKNNPMWCLEEIRTLLAPSKANNLLLIGDTLADVKFAHAIGISVACVRYGFGDPQKLASSSPDYLGNALADFSPLFYS